MRNALTILLCAACLAATDSALGDVQPGTLRCEYLVNPAGIDVARPRLGWVVPCQRRGQKQTAYRVLVAGSREELDANSGARWDSGKVESDRSTLVEYAGRPLESRQRCHWKVMVWDERGRPSAWSEPASWSMGLLDPADWTARWIAGPKPSAKDKAPHSLWLRKTFTLPAKPKRAEVYIASIGYHELYVNGRKVGKHVLSPAVCDYRHRALYLTCDVAEYLVEGKNCIALWLGRGWAAHKPYELANGLMAKAQLEATLSGGRTLRVPTDASWKWHATPISYLGQWRWGRFGGERYDAALDLPGWNTTELDDSNWEAAGLFESPVAELSAQMVEPDRLIETIKPQDVRELAPGVWVVDMGRNYSGWLKIGLVGKPGQTIQLDYSELPVDKPGMQTFRQNDQYLPRGSGKEVFRNRFNYHAFRWVTVSGTVEPPKLEDVEGYLIHSDYRRTGRFECSNELLNRISDTVLWTYRCLSLGGYVVDCPHRERLGYGAEGQVAVDTALYGFDQGALYTKWMADWRDVQDPASGEVPHTAPTYVGGGGPAWGGIVVTLPWQSYLQYGDQRILADNYPMMKAYLGWLQSKTKDHIMQPFGGEWDFLADWVAPGRNVAPKWTWTPEPLRIFFNTCYLCYVTQLTAQIAEVLGKPGEAAEYRRQAEAINRAVHAAYYDAKNAQYVNGEQPYQALALLTGTVPADLRGKVMNSLDREIRIKHKGHIDSGVLGTYFLLKGLTRAERHDLVYPMVSSRTYPSWGHMLDRGATTIWERWDGYASRNHTSFLSVGAWFVEGLAGIRSDPSQPGFKHFFIRPALLGDIKSARAQYDSIRGRVAADWRIEDKNFLLTIDVPSGSSATVHLPTTDRATVRESGKPAEKAEGVRFLRSEPQTTIYRISSGRYGFSVPMPAGNGN